MPLTNSARFARNGEFLGAKGDNETLVTGV